MTPKGFSERAFKPRLKFSADQRKAINTIKEWAEHGGQELRFGGLAGTGKTTITASLREMLDYEIVYCAPTGKAARVLQSKLRERNALEGNGEEGKASTISQPHLHAGPATLPAVPGPRFG